MLPPTADWLQEMETAGFVIVPAVFGKEETSNLVRDLISAISGSAAQCAAIRSREGGVYAARNVLALWPPAAKIWRQSPLPEMLAALLGPNYGLVRVLYFDKPPERTWSLPWHKDLTIAVRDNTRPSSRFTKPTRKAGVPHVEAPQELLEAMVILRIHLDDMIEENGPLKVIPGSHHSGKAMQMGEVPPRTILVDQGDILLIRPLVAHSSVCSHPDTKRHRRILHCEFAASPNLPDGYAWHDFVPQRTT
jgi:hypothetical protein